MVSSLCAWRPGGHSQLKWVLGVTDPMAVGLGGSSSLCLSLHLLQVGEVVSGESDVLNSAQWRTELEP